jgi:hypothetical protein
MFLHFYNAICHEGDVKGVSFSEGASTQCRKGAALNGSKQMTVTSMFAKTSSKRKSDKCQVPENGLLEKEQSMEELTVLQDSVGKKALKTADTELQVEKKVKLGGGDPEDELLVSIILFCSFSICMKYLICCRLDVFCLHKLNWQAVSSRQFFIKKFPVSYPLEGYFCLQ